MASSGLQQPVSARTGTPAAPEDTSLPLLPLGPDGVRRAPPRRTCPSARGQHTAPPRRLSTHDVTRGVATCHIVPASEENDTARAVSVGGEGGIRTHGALRLTRSPSARVRPDYATSPGCACPSSGRHRHYSMCPPPPPTGGHTSRPDAWRRHVSGRVLSQVYRQTNTLPIPTPFDPSCGWDKLRLQRGPCRHQTGGRLRRRQHGLHGQHLAGGTPGERQPNNHHGGAESTDL